MRLGLSNIIIVSPDSFHGHTCIGLKMREIGARCSRTRKCSQRYKINRFCSCFFQQFNLLKFSPQAGAMEPQGCVWLHSSKASLSQCMFGWWLTNAFVATMLLFIYPYGSTTKCKYKISTMAIRSNFVVIIVPLWVDHKM